MISRRLMTGRWIWVLTAIEALVIWLANFGGLWWMASLVGFSMGLLVPFRRGIGAAAIAGAAGWALGLLWVAVRDPIGPTASAVSITLGMGDSAIPSLLVTVLLGALLAATAAWFGRSLQRFAHPQIDERVPRQ